MHYGLAPPSEVIAITVDSEGGGTENEKDKSVATNKPPVIGQNLGGRNSRWDRRGYCCRSLGVGLW